MAAFFCLKKKTGLVGPASYSVELRCGYITARRKLTPNLHIGSADNCYPTSEKSKETLLG
jgi:hypothetical protein